MTAERLVFKLDENLPAVAAAAVETYGHVAHTVQGQDLSGASDAAVYARAVQERAILVTLDRGFGNIRRYPPGQHRGVVILLPTRQDAESVRSLLKTFLATLPDGLPHGATVIVEPSRLRIRRPG